MLGAILNVMNSSPTPPSVTIRPAYPNDTAALRRLAELDSSVPIAEPQLVAEVDGVIRVAVSLSGGAVIADPFVATAPIVEMVQDHIARTAEPARSGRRRFRPTVAAVLRAS